MTVTDDMVDRLRAHLMAQAKRIYWWDIADRDVVNDESNELIGTKDSFLNTRFDLKAALEEALKT